MDTSQSTHSTQPDEAAHCNQTDNPGKSGSNTASSNQNPPNLTSPLTSVGQRGIAVLRDVKKSILLTGDNNKVRVKYIVNLPRTLYQDLREHVFTRWRIMLLLAGLQALLIALFIRIKDRYLLSWDLYTSLAFLLLVTTIGWLRFLAIIRANTPFTPRIKWVWLLIAGITSGLWIGLAGWQSQQVLWPAPFPAEKFGIALATFGDGTTDHTNTIGRELTTRLLGEVQQAINNNKDLRDLVTVRRLGVLSDSNDRADTEGKRLGAELIIWGSLVMHGNMVDIHFKLLQSAALLDNPSYPQHLPVTEVALEMTLSLPYENTDSLKLITEKYSLGIAAFSFGLAHFQNRAYQLADQQFTKARDAFLEAATLYTTPAASAQNIGLLSYYLGRCKQILGRFAESQRMFDEAARYNPNEIAVLLGQIYNYRVFGEEKARRAAYERVIALSMELPPVQKQIGAYNRALAFEQLAEYDVALTEYRTIIEQDPTFFVAYLGAANLLTRQQKFTEAAELYDQATAVAGNDRIRQIWLNLGKAQLFERSGQLQQALDTYLHAIALDTDHTVISLYNNLAQLYGKLGRTEEAITSYQTLIKISYQPNWAHGVFADYLRSIGHCVQAVHEYNVALQYAAFDQSMQYAHLGLAYACATDAEFANREALATQAFEQALAQATPSEAWIRHEYGRILHGFGHPQQAIVQMEKSLAVDQGPAIKTHLNLGKLYRSSGANNRAVEMYEYLMKICNQLGASDLWFVRTQLEQLGGDTTQCPLTPAG